jgi:hypothetical protein
MADTYQWNVCVRTGDLKGKFSKQMKQKKLSYRIIRIKSIFPGVYESLLKARTQKGF